MCAAFNSVCVSRDEREKRQIIGQEEQPNKREEL